MTRVQMAVLAGLGIVVIIVVVVAGALLFSEPEPTPVAVPTLVVATVPPNPQLQARIPLCRQVVGERLHEQGWPSVVSLDPQRAVLEIRMDLAGGSTEAIPAGQIWGAFEVALAGRAEGCSGYSQLVVQVGDFRAEVAVDDLVAWESNQLDDGEFSGRVVLTH